MTAAELYRLLDRSFCWELICVCRVYNHDGMCDKKFPGNDILNEKMGISN